MTFEDAIERVKSLYPDEDEFPEAKGLIQVIKQSCLDGTSIVSLVMAEDFNVQRSETFTIPTDQAEIRESKVNLAEKCCSCIRNFIYNSILEFYIFFTLMTMYFGL